MYVNSIREFLGCRDIDKLGRLFSVKIQTNPGKEATTVIDQLDVFAEVGFEAAHIRSFRLRSSWPCNNYFYDTDSTQLSPEITVQPEGMFWSTERFLLWYISGTSQYTFRPVNKSNLGQYTVV
jgi:hypothetical protein